MIDPRATYILLSVKRTIPQSHHLCLRARARSYREYDAARDLDRHRAHWPDDRPWRSESRGIAHIGQTIDLGDRNLEAAGIDQASKFPKHLCVCRGAVACRLDTVLVAAAKSRCSSDPFRNPISIGDRDHAVTGKPSTVCKTGEPNDLSTNIPSQLHRDRTHATCGTRDDDGVTCFQRNGLHCRIRRYSCDEQDARLLQETWAGRWTRWSASTMTSSA
jgi:hypothetical protein